MHLKVELHEKDPNVKLWIFKIILKQEVRKKEVDLSG
jgi:hypothetical protein